MMKSATESTTSLLTPPETILVTGGAGFIGTHLCAKLIALGHRVRVLDLRSPETPLTRVEYAQGDVRDAELLTDLLDGVTTVYHLAATVSVPLCQRDPVESYSNNFTATVIVLDAIRRLALSNGKPPVRLVFASTAALYAANGDDGHALRETEAATSFSSFYGAQKYACEQAMDQFRQAYGVPSIAFRFFNVFGPGQDPTSPYSGVISIFAKLAKEGKPLHLNSAGKPTRDFISVHDIVQGLTRALALPTHRWDARAFNLGTGRALSIRELGEIIVRASGKGSILVDAPAREGDVMHSLADISRASQIFDFKPENELESSLRDLLKTI